MKANTAREIKSSINMIMNAIDSQDTKVLKNIIMLLVQLSKVKENIKKN